MYYVTDTHAFLWYLTNSPKLSSKARTIFDACDLGKATIIIPAIVLLECIDIFDKKKINLDFENIVSKILQANNFIFSEVNWSLVLEVNKVKGLRDLHDRLIVATTRVFDASLISRDKTIKNFYKRTIW